MRIAFKRSWKVNYVYKKHQIQINFLDDSNYPKSLEYYPDAPSVLNVKGYFSFEKRKTTSILCIDKNHFYALSFCQKLTKVLVVIDPIIVSVFANGIGVIEHKQALKSSLDVVGCLAYGFDKIASKGHNKYFRDIEEEGSFVTDFTSSEVFDRNNLIRRNRITAGLKNDTVVIQSNIKGGSMNMDIKLTSSISTCLSSFTWLPINWAGRINWQEITRHRS